MRKWLFRILLQKTKRNRDMNKQRQESIQKVLNKGGVGAFILWRSDELIMALGYQPLWGISVCLFPALGMPVLYIPEMEPRDRLPGNVVIKTFPWGLMDCSDPWTILFGMIKQDIEKLEVDNLPVSFIQFIGQSSPPIMAGEGAPLPPELLEKMATMSKGGYKDITSGFLELYTIKNATEIERIVLTNKVAAIGVKTFYENLVPGKSEVEVASAVEAAIQNQVNDTDIKYAKAWPLIQSGVNTIYGGRFNRSTGKKLEDGELVMIEMGLCVNGYWADITRTGNTGNMADEHLNLFKVVSEAQKKAVKAIAPGKTTGEIDQIARDHITGCGYGQYFRHALGHHVGFRYHDPGSPLFPGGKAILREGMIYTVEPGIYGAELGMGARIEDNVLVTSDGFRILSDFSRGLKW
jgi:Xaa-Pro dipeptidase